MNTGGTGAGSEKKPHAGGRPSKYNPELHVPIAKAMARMGAIDEEVAAEIGIDIATLYRWKVSNPKFCEALKKGKEVTDERVVDSLYKRAIGYDYEEKHYEYQNFDSEGNRLAEPIRILIKSVTKHVIPDVTAQIYWTKNRMEDWQDVRNIKVSGSLTEALNELGEEKKE